MTGKNMSSAGCSRNLKWDNIKGVMVFLVVYGHMLYYCMQDSNVMKGIYVFIYLFHIPTLFFVSGYLSESAIRRQRWDRAAAYLICYILLKTGITAIRGLKTGTFSVHFLWDSTPAWYLLAMVAYLLLTMILIQRFSAEKLLIFALILGCAAGLDNHLGDHYASMRIAVFYPFFILGLVMRRRRFFKGSHKLPFRLAAGIPLYLICLTALMFGKTLYRIIPFLKGRVPYSSLGISGYEGLIFRLFYYAAVSLLIWCIVIAAPERKTVFSEIGRNSLAVYIIHPLVITLLFEVFRGETVIRQIWPTLSALAVLLLALLLSIILGNRTLDRLIRSIF